MNRQEVTCGLGLLMGVLLICLAADVAAAQEADRGDARAYLFTSFRGNGEDGLKFAYSLDGYKWTDIPGHFLRPRVGYRQLMRDPCIVRGESGPYHLVWTTGWDTDQGFGYASSDDLVHWSPQRFIPVMEHEPTTVNVWAPEAFYDAHERRFIICWASTIPGRFPDHLEPHDNNQRMYYTTTTDFKQFTPTKLFFDPGFSVIDCCIVPRGDEYTLILKDNTRPQRNLRTARGDRPLGPWHDVSAPFTGRFTEGPTVLRAGDEWLIYFDAYQKHTYDAVKTRDFETFEDISDKVSFPAGHKHGSILQVTRRELDDLLLAGSEQQPAPSLPLASQLSEDETRRRLANIDTVARQEPYLPYWSSLGKFEPPDWYRDAKFGIFIHWGPYAVPAFGNEWYPRSMYCEGSPEFKHHLENYGPQAEFGYKDFIPLFKAERFDAVQWAELFKESGARYVIPVFEHHDGFAMYDSELTPWCATKKGPRRDVLGELAAALAGQQIVLGASSHRAEHWWFFGPGMMFDADVRNEAYASLYGPAHNKRVSENQSEPPDSAFLDDWLLRSCEIVDKYRPRVMYFDWWICQPAFQPYLRTFAAYYYNRGAEWGVPVAINFKEWEGRSFPRGTGILDVERGRMSDIQPTLWQTCTSVSSNSWGHVSNQQYRSVDAIIDDLVDIVSKNGTMLLNVGPKADGTIPDQEQDVLRSIGRWLAVNGEAIYGSRPWHRFGEGPTAVPGGSFSDRRRSTYTASDIRFTTNQDALYATVLAWPEGHKVTITSLAQGARDATSEVQTVELLGHDGPLKWTRTKDGLEVSLPREHPTEFAFTLKVVGLVSRNNDPDVLIAQATSAALPEETAEERAAYRQVVTQRAERIVSALALEDKAAAADLVTVIADQYEALSRIHARRDAAVVGLPEQSQAAMRLRNQAELEIRNRHYQFVASLAAGLEPEKVEQVKDGMTYGVMPNMYRRYCELLPHLSAAERAKIRALLWEAREHAMDAGSSEEKHGWFRKYKGKINNYLSTAGYDMQQAERDWAARSRQNKEG